MRTTLVIPSYQRREALRALLLAIDAQQTPDLDIVVVLDGSTDGSAEMARQLPLGVPLRVLEQPNQGQGSARNRGLESVDHDGLVWFLDDDMLPSPGLVAAHGDAHADGTRQVVMGPCLFPPERRIVRDNRRWADELYDTLAATGQVEDPSLFSVANTSAPVDVWRELGGFHEHFAGWGAEDHELGVRVLGAGIPVRYVTDAVAWHHQERSVVGMCRTKEEEGANRVRLTLIHPDQLDLLFPIGAPGRWARRLGPLARWPRLLRVTGRALAAVAEVEFRTVGSSRLLRPAVSASLLAGVAGHEDGEPFVRYLVEGRPAGTTPPSRAPRPAADEASGPGPRPGAAGGGAH